VDGFEVDVAELRHAVGRVRALAESFAEVPSLRYTVATGEVGSEELARALTEFHEASLRGARGLCALTEETAVRLADTADDYERRDQVSAGTIGGTTR
jgi:hypothetical protein